MARFTYKLRNPKSEEPTPVNLVVNYTYNRVVFYTRESINPKFWDKVSHRAKLSKSFPEHPEFNSRLDKLEETAKDIFRRYQNDNDHKEPSPNEYKKLLEETIRGTKNSIPVSLIEFAEYFIEETRKKLKAEKRVSTRSDIAGSYSQTLTCLKDFAKDKNRRIDFDTMDNDFYTAFVKYLETSKTIEIEGKKVKKYGFSLNNVGKHIKNLKRILNEAASPEMDVNKFTFYRRFKVSKEDTETIYLNESELQALYELDLSDNLRLDRVRDLFLVGCWTGLRFSDFTNIKAKDIRGEFIHITTQKTGERVVIPIHWTVKAIMAKYTDYTNSLPPDISNVNMNKYLKELGRKLDILDLKTETSRTRAGRKITANKQKYELLTTHTARRSFATNMFKAGVPTISIMKVTGHKTEKAFLKYIKVTPDEHARIMLGYFKNQNLKIA